MDEGDEVDEVSTLARLTAQSRLPSTDMQHQQPDTHPYQSRDPHAMIEAYCGMQSANTWMAEAVRRKDVALTRVEAEPMTGRGEEMRWVPGTLPSRGLYESKEPKNSHVSGPWNEADTKQGPKQGHKVLVAQAGGLTSLPWMLRPRIRQELEGLDQRECLVDGRVRDKHLEGMKPQREDLLELQIAIESQVETYVFNPMQDWLVARFYCLTGGRIFFQRGSRGRDLPGDAEVSPDWVIMLRMPNGTIEPLAVLETKLRCPLAVSTIATRRQTSDAACRISPVQAGYQGKEEINVVIQTCGNAFKANVGLALFLDSRSIFAVQRDELRQNEFAVSDQGQARFREDPNDAVAREDSYHEVLLYSIVFKFRRRTRTWPFLPFRDVGGFNVPMPDNVKETAAVATDRIEAEMRRLYATVAAGGPAAREATEIRLANGLTLR